MFALIPYFVLMGAAVAVALIQRVRRSVGYSWLVAVGLAMAVTGWMVFLRWKLPQVVQVKNWLPFAQFTDAPIFGLDGSSWPYALSLLAVMLAVMLTASGRLQVNANPLAWAGTLAVTGMSYLTVLSANMLTLALAWSALDISELVVLQVNSTNRKMGVQTVIAFSVRVTGTLLVLVAALVCRSEGLPPSFGKLPSVAWLLLLLAAGLRLGVLPLHLPFGQELPMRRGLGTMVRMAAAASSLALLVRLPPQPLSVGVARLLVTLTALAALYGASMWLVSTDEVNGRPYWVIALGGLAVACTLQGQPQASLAWGTALLLSGGLIFLFSARQTSILFLPVLGLLGFSGLPFTPAASGWAGLFAGKYIFADICFLLTHILLMLGYTRLLFLPGESLRNMERWVQVAYPLGLGILVLAQWMNGLLGWPGAFSSGLWWAALISAAGVVIGFGLTHLRRRIVLADQVLGIWLGGMTRQVGGFLAEALGLNWLYRILWWIFRLLQRGIEWISNILEGDGGVLWIFVLLALFISLIRYGGGQ